METIKLTGLERQYLNEAVIDETDYIDDDDVTIPQNQVRGVVASLIKKGIMSSEYDEGRLAQDEVWFAPTDNGRKYFINDYSE